MNWHYQSYQGNAFFAATGTWENMPRTPHLLFDFSIYPGLYIYDDLDLYDSFESHHAMLDTTGRGNYEYEFIQATPFTPSPTNTTERHLMYDDKGLYLSDVLLKALQARQPITIIHRKLVIRT